MHVHGREEGDVEQHGHQDEQGETEACIEFVWQMNAENIMLMGVGQASQLAQQLPSHSSGIGNYEECISIREYLC